MGSNVAADDSTFSRQPPFENCPLIDPQQASDLTSLFKIFANGIRLRMLHFLVRDGEVRVTDLVARVEMKPQAVSNHLQRLLDRGILGSRREGNNILYRIIDPCVPVLLELGLCLIESES